LESEARRDWTDKCQAEQIKRQQVEQELSQERNMRFDSEQHKGSLESRMADDQKQLRDMEVQLKQLSEKLAVLQSENRGLGMIAESEGYISSCISLTI